MKESKHVEVANASVKMEQVNVCGAMLSAGKDANGVVHVPVKRVCEALGIDDDAQRVKLQSLPWAVTLMIKATGPDGRNYDTFCIDLESLPMWLATIHTSKVRPEARAQLLAFQCEAKRVLAAHFFGTPNQIDVHELVQAAIKSIALPLLEEIKTFHLELADVRAEMATMRAEQAAQRLESGVIGPDRAARYLARVRLIAHAWVVQGRATSTRSAGAAIRQHLAAVLGFGGTGKAWVRFPVFRVSELEVALASLERDAKRIPEVRRAQLAPHIVQEKLPFGLN